MTEADLVAAIVAAPDDSAQRMVYADWLEQRGDPRAELVRIEDIVWREPIDLVRYRALSARRTELRARCDPQWTVAIARPSTATIRRRVAILAELDVEREIFAASSHGYVLNPPLAETEVRAIEDGLGCALPAQYRRFVLEVADGGAGPDYGIAAIAGTSASIADFVPPTNAPDEEFDPVGAIEIAEVGCGSQYWLVLAGPEAGQIWLQGDRGWAPVPVGAWGTIEEMCALPRTARREFLDWYADWLDESLTRIARTRPDDDSVFDRPVEHAVDVNLRARSLVVVPEQLRRLTELARLDLGKNPLVELPDWIGDFARLEHLALDFTTVKRLPDAITRLRALRHLSCFQGKELVELPEELGRLVELRYLDLRYNAIERLPDSFGELVNLETLQIHNNALTTVPASFGKLRQLEALDLSFCELVDLPDELGALDRVTDVNLRGNSFVTLPACLGRLPLETITLGDNPQLDLASVCRVLEHVPTLRHLSFGSSELAEVPDDLARLTQLTSIYLGWNRLVTLPDSLARLTQLRELDLSGNGTRDGDREAQLSALRARAYALLPELDA